MRAETLAALKAGIILEPADLRILVALSLRGPISLSTLREALNLWYADIKQRLEELERRHLAAQVPIFLPEDAVRLGWNIAPSPGFEFALHALADTLDVETLKVKSAI